MLKHSFIFLPGMGKQREQKLWSQGITDWNIFLNQNSVQGISSARKVHYDSELKQAKTSLQTEDLSYFCRNFPSQESWRFYDHFKNDACFLDIETNGFTTVTIVGLYDGYETKTFVKGINLDFKILKEELAKYQLIVTFNGSSFDLPVLRKYDPTLFTNQLHLDLRHACARIGLRGGLKQIERTLGIQRQKEVQEIGGDMAIYLWQQWCATGERSYLESLVKYNEEDIINLKPLAAYTCSALAKQTVQRYKPDIQLL